VSSKTETLQGDVLVALSGDPRVKEALLSGCGSTKALPPSASTLLASGLLAQVPSGTKMKMPSWDGNRYVGTMTISEGKLNGRQVLVCSGQYALLHAWP
jgi:hypothetical protein